MNVFASVRFILSSHGDGICTSLQINVQLFSLAKRLPKGCMSKKAFPKRLGGMHAQKGFPKTDFPKKVVPARETRCKVREACIQQASWSCCRVVPEDGREVEMKTVTKKAHLY